MAKLKYDRPININLSESASTRVPNGEVWKVSTDESSDGSGANTNLYGGVHIQGSRQLRSSHLWHRLQAHRRISDSMEVVLHG